MAQAQGQIFQPAVESYFNRGSNGGLTKAVQRILNNVKRNEKTGCVEWQGKLHVSGYAQTTVNGKSQFVHRVIAYVGGIELTPERPFVLHECDNKKCCNLKHLRAGSQSENMADLIKAGRGMAAKQRKLTHCKRGHEFNEANTHVCIRKSGATWRSCRKCSVLKTQRYEARKKVS